MKKLIYLFALVLLTSCGMDYEYFYIQEKMDNRNVETDLVELDVFMTISKTKTPNVYILETHVKAPQEVDLNAISLKINFNPDLVTFEDSVKINEKLYINEWLDPALIGGTFYNITQDQICYSFATIQQTKITEAFIFRQPIKVSGSCFLEFSKIPGDVEFESLDGYVYPLNVQYIIFVKK